MEVSVNPWAPFEAALKPIEEEQRRITAAYEAELRPLRDALRAKERERDAALAPLQRRSVAIMNAYDRGSDVVPG